MPYDKRYFKKTYGQPHQDGETLTRGQAFKRDVHNATLVGVDCAHNTLTCMGKFPALDLACGGMGVAWGFMQHICDTQRRVSAAPADPSEGLQSYFQLRDHDADSRFSDDDDEDEDTADDREATHRIRQLDTDDETPSTCDMTRESAIKGRDAGWLGCCTVPCCVVWGVPKAVYKAGKHEWDAHNADPAVAAASRRRGAATPVMS